MSRLFDGVDDVMSYQYPAGGNPGPVNYTFGTVLIVARFVTAPTWASFVEQEQATGGLVVGGFGRDAAGALYYSDGSVLRRSNEAGTGTTFTIGTGDNWCLYSVVKPTGTSACSFYKVPIATGTRTSFTHGSTSIQAVGLANGIAKLGGDDDFANIRVAAAAIMPGVALTGAQLDAIVAAKTTSSIISVAGSNGWVVDDSDGLVNNLVANNTNRSAVVGTASDGDNPAGWTYGATGGNTFTKAGSGIVGP